MAGVQGRTRRLPPIALAVVVAPLAMALGIWGYARAFPELSVTDTIYRSLQLFAVDAQIPTRGTPWQLDIARFTAPLAVVYAAVLAAIALLRTRYDGLWVRLLARDHVVVIGLGDTGVRVVRGLRAMAKPPAVVAVELDPRNPNVPTARSYGARVVVADATADRVLGRVRVARAGQIVVVTGDDSLNLEVGAAIRRSASGARRRLGLHVVLDHLDLWRELSRVRLLVKDTVDTEYVHLPDRAALRLLDELGVGDATSPRVLLEGDDPIAARAASHLLRRALGDGREPLVAVGDQLRLRLRTEEPWVLEHLRPHDELPPDAVLVCAGSDGDAGGIARGLQLADRHPGAEVVVTVHHEGSERRLEITGSRGGRVRLAPPRVHEFAKELFERSAIELLAQARHSGYVAEQEARSVTIKQNSSLRPWADLPDSLKVSNRRYAEAIAAYLGSFGAELVPMIGPPRRVEECFSTDKLEQLAIAEHDRWMRDLQADGWRTTSGSKDPDAKLHPLLVPWSELSQADREKDRQSVRDLPAMLARIGYALVIPERTA